MTQKAIILSTMERLLLNQQHYQSVMYSPSLQFSIFRKKTAREEVSVTESGDMTTSKPMKSAFASDKNTPLSDIFARLSRMNSAQES
ncbi:hypothetical protein [Undibacterium squillarum]|uniref:Uncharacterized protein n=1 Tax=Undibacterium squillarum TaxID=1131567 RepID=A0ABQ2XSX5_9BURK|nr:hypothetical protein [Undibacterium squillarum]GGX32651.1 hypothetical protein GCM10010946_07360 [Undibacterium squillarum]